MVKSKMNPNIKKIEVGIKEVREVKIYPLSVADHLKATGIVKKISNEIDFDNATNKEIVQMITGTLEEKIVKIIELVTDPSNTFTMEELDITQLSILIEKIYETNFENALKNFKSLFNKIKTAFQLKRKPQVSVKDMEDIDLKISTESPILKEDQQ